MREREIKTAKQCGVLARCMAFERELLKINDIVPDRHDDGVFVDYSYCEVIICPKYSIRADREDYWGARHTLITSVVELANLFDLHRTSDRIEDYGEHFYFVFGCGQSWKGGKNG